ncbi:endo-1,4-beta-xylanase [Brasilonema sp. UFV-L1]|uniref:endo-1,4-beta-xylanase n=1 Tax=Brasilonema sp. UFV-L1 TaxID=2234130 RepID=UPI00145C8DF8|nr:endo-1,4-beta-xylanase [Brasilonema sp. UFV-L1]NMG11032.1 glycosyl hydrolase family 10 [Brasilonema sp. UFV-L1]
MLKNWKLFKRRNFLLGLGTLASTVFFATVTKRFSFDKKAQASNNPNRDFSVVGNAPLSKRAAVKGLTYGAFPSFGYNTLSQDKQLESTFIRECGFVVGGFYWANIRPSVSTFNFAETDSLARFASKHRMLFRGHPLIWDNVVPQWLIDKLDNPNTKSQEIQNIFINHISTVVKRYAGKIHSWDVINEAVEPDDGRTDNLRKTSWLKFLGPNYIDLAFRTAAKADPKALLVYNDFGVEYDIPSNEAKRKALLKLLEGLKSKGTPVHAFGIQSHLIGHETRFNPKKLRKFLADIASLGLKILITELDVRDDKLPADIAVRDRIIASAYEDYLSVVLDEKAVIAVLNWGFHDRYTWYSQANPRSDGKPPRPLPFDSNLRRKLAWNAMARAFDKAPKR